MGSPPMNLVADQKDLKAEFSGNLKKWTNYILGWQSRFFVLQQGNLSYYKSESDVEFGCRGAINLSNASLVTHDFDECRFDVRVGELIWYLCSDSAEIRRTWENALTMHTRIPRATLTSLHSDFSSQVREKLRDAEFYREKLCQESSNLLSRLSHQNVGSDESSPLEIHSDVSQLKSALSELISIIQNCLEMIDDRSKFLIFGREPSDPSFFSLDSPDMVEGRHCLLGDDEFFDAVESGLDKIEEEAEMKKKFGLESLHRPSPTTVEHPLWPKISQKTDEQILLAANGLDGSSWVLLLDEENMKMYSKEVEVGGLVSDPLKAVCTVEGVTGRELCHYFFNPEFRQDWEPTVERMEVVERIGQDVIVFHQVYKTLWPAAQRDTLFWSHLVKRPEPGEHDVWAVVNDSFESPELPANEGKLVRVKFTACLHCVTTSGSPVTRKNVTTRLTYCAVVNPGGWVPASAVRALRRKEYPKFLKKFTSYVVGKTANSELLL